MSRYFEYDAPSTLDGSEIITIYQNGTTKSSPINNIINDLVEAPITALGALGTTVTLDADNRPESYFTGTLGASETTFTLSNIPSGIAVAVSMELVTGGTVVAPIFTDTTPTPTIEADKTYRMIWTPKYTSTGYWLQVAEIT